MKFVQAIDWHEAGCECGHKELTPSILRLKIKGANVEVHLCAACVAQMIKELTVPLGNWAATGVHWTKGNQMGDPEIEWPPGGEDW
jgi:hypothetical protein